MYRLIGLIRVMVCVCVYSLKDSGGVFADRHTVSETGPRVDPDDDIVSVTEGSCFRKYEVIQNRPNAKITMRIDR